MKSKKFLLVVGISLLLALMTVGAASAHQSIEWPDCGEYSVRVWPGYEDENIIANYTFLQSGLEVQSFNGWEIVHIELDQEWENSTYDYPAGTTHIIESTSSGFWNIMVDLKKDCSPDVSEAKFTGRYVYTLFGDYPCNLISAEKSIPERFLNPAYTAPLCALADRQHNWNGDWNKSEEKEIGGYFIGGNHYDTRPDPQP